MRIKKTSATAPIQAQVLNAESVSEVDTYSCNYINNIRKIATASLNTVTSVGNGGVINFDTFDSTTTALTWNSTDKGIAIGAGIHKILVSANLHIRYTSSNSATYGFAIVNNGTEISNARCYKATTNPITCSSSGVLVDVEEGDLIQMTVVSSSGAPDLTFKTSLTVEAIN